MFISTEAQSPDQTFITSLTKVFIVTLSPGFLDLDAAAQLLQNELPGVVVNDEHAVLLVRPLVSFEDRHGRRGALQG